MAARDLPAAQVPPTENAIGPRQARAWLPGNQPTDPITFGLASPSTPFWDETPFPFGSLDPSNANRSPWDIVHLAGLDLPGLSKIEGDCKRHKKLEKKDRKGSNGLSITFTGYAAAEFTIKTRIYTSEQLLALELMLPLLQPLAQQSSQKQTKVAAGVDIYHPALALLKINQVVIESIGILRETAVRGIREFDIRCIEFIPSTKKNVTATTTSSQNLGNNTQSAIVANPNPFIPPAPSQSHDYTGPFALLGFGR